MNIDTLNFIALHCTTLHSTALQCTAHIAVSKQINRTESDGDMVVGVAVQLG